MTAKVDSGSQRTSHDYDTCTRQLLVTKPASKEKPPGTQPASTVKLVDNSGLVFVAGAAFFFGIVLATVLVIAIASSSGTGRLPTYYQTYHTVSPPVKVDEDSYHILATTPDSTEPIHLILPEPPPSEWFKMEMKYGTVVLKPAEPPTTPGDMAQLRLEKEWAQFQLLLHSSDEPLTSLVIGKWVSIAPNARLKLEHTTNYKNGERSALLYLMLDKGEDTEIISLSPHLKIVPVEPKSEKETYFGTEDLTLKGAPYKLYVVLKKENLGLAVEVLPKKIELLP